MGKNNKTKLSFNGNPQRIPKTISDQTFLVGPNHDTKLQSKKVNQIIGDHLQIAILKVSELGRIN